MKKSKFFKFKVEGKIYGMTRQTAINKIFKYLEQKGDTFFVSVKEIKEVKQ